MWLGDCLPHSLNGWGTKRRTKPRPETAHVAGGLPPTSPGRVRRVLPQPVALEVPAKGAPKRRGRGLPTAQDVLPGGRGSGGCDGAPCPPHTGHAGRVRCCERPAVSTTAAGVGRVQPTVPLIDAPSRLRGPPTPLAQRQNTHQDGVPQGLRHFDLRPGRRLDGRSLLVGPRLLLLAPAAAAAAPAAPPAAAPAGAPAAAAAVAVAGAASTPSRPAGLAKATLLPLPPAAAAALLPGSRADEPGTAWVSGGGGAAAGGATGRWAKHEPPRLHVAKWFDLQYDALDNPQSTVNAWQRPDGGG
jgi:hypothetical protein